MRRNIRFCLIFGLVALFVACNGHTSSMRSSEKDTATLIHLIEKHSTEEKATYQVVFFVPEVGCSCHYLEALDAVQRAIHDERLLCGVCLVAPSKREHDLLVEQGIPQGSILTAGSLETGWPISFPIKTACMLVLRSSKPSRPLAYFQIPQVGADQLVAGEIVRTLRSMSGEQQHAGA